MSDLKNKKNKIAKKIERNTEINTENNIHCNKTKYTYKRPHNV
jgi:transcription initiation factor IIE alpha subunit